MKVALVGSSGGGAATLSSGEAILNAIKKEFSKVKQNGNAEFEISTVALVVSAKGFDFVNETDNAALWILANGSPQKLCEGNLVDINNSAKIEDQKIASKIESGEICALVSISSDPSNINQLAIQAAIKTGIPIVGTGGQSISHISTHGGNVIGCSGGSVATTSASRSICFAASLSSYFHLKYNPLDHSKDIKLSSIFGGSLPFLLSVALSRWMVANVAIPLSPLSWHPQLEAFTRALQRVVPTMVAMTTCHETCEMSELAMLAGAAAGTLLPEGAGILCAIVCGYVCGKLLMVLLVACAKGALLPTSTTLVSVGFSAVLAGGLATLGAPPLNELTRLYVDTLRSASSTLVSLFPIGDPRGVGAVYALGGAAGWAFSWGSENGYYHTVMLPLVALEMERGDFSLVGALDFWCLCLPCAGVCAAVWTLARNNMLSLPPSAPGEGIDGGKQQSNNNEAHVRICRGGFVSNVILGDFVESCYPYSLPNAPILGAVRVAASVAGAVIVAGNVCSSAYLPLPVSLLVVSQGGGDMALAMCGAVVAFCVPFVVTLLWLSGAPAPTRRP